ncbi:leucine-rich repeat and WD repeat-containing protein 1 [Nerophis ophidion]|uniref:leucine-rich repeat and WD repeat-containing protein 1 n=1 Tax=Nerophis ophidion TaxID=159077 RepID=UPI002AE09E72|nr:leucine-rich repeat and WD repeat-containing protein 1 [Nerophis ophidion]XP_061754991.1 leucine-rich repeat and WD repeat-containing protein 1 [Nerophis ophidion]XP_061754992.1 leucine-rich repeat and WD repeat-containing protein 1 [Nerophis ophidion]XP_061754993.1 leucine-rich repeat and WD repeat-containing protein 1 [Nerophis ophidion]
MEKITEKLLLEKGSPKSEKLEDIKTLNLSKLGLKCADLPVKLLSRLWSLESWDLSGNRLQEIPKKLTLPKLRRLDLSDNQMEDVTTLECLCSLEEVKMEDNLYITVSDNYKLMTLLPNLRSYNGKDVTTTANRVRFVFTENLKTRIVAVWEKSFSLPDPFTEQKLSVLEKDFVNAACREVKYGPSSVSDFTKWKVATMAREYLQSLVAPKEETPNKTCVSTPVKRKHQTPALSDSQVSLTPLKKPRSDLSAPPAEDSPRKSSLRLRNQVLTGGVPLSPDRKKSRPSTPTRASAKKAAARKPCNVRTMKIVAADGARGQRGENTSYDAIKKSCGRTQPVRLQPLHVLQCHSKQDNSEDFSTQLWACAFQPQPDSSGSRLVATCGGDSVCVIDCEAGMVMKKYKVPGEEFFTLAWSTVLMSRGGGASALTCSILAAGGKRGLVKLIHPKYNVAYGEFRASRKALSVLRFNHRRGNFLFTGSYDNKIILWDIGGVDSSYNFKVLQLLALESSATPLHICLPPAGADAHLLAACDDGLHCYNTQLSPSSATKRSRDAEITFPVYEQEDKDHDYHTVDGLSFLTDDIVASKNFTHGRIYLWSWNRTRSQRPGKSGRLRAAVLAELRWVNTDIPYLAVNTCPGRAYVVCGDNEGRLWTYHVTDIQKDRFQTGTAIEPTEVLQWPAPVCKVLGKVEGPSINSVAMDPDFQYLVALSDKNMVVVWKRIASS